MSDTEGEEEEAISPVDRPITDVTVEDVEVSCRDFVSFLVDFFTVGRIVRALLYISFFILIGHFYKVWLWFDVCVRESTGVPCSNDFSLFSSPFPLDLSFIAGDETIQSRSIFAVDWAHLLCSVRAATFLSIPYGVFWLFKRFVYSRIRTRIVAAKQARVTRRRNLVKSRK